MVVDIINSIISSLEPLLRLYSFPGLQLVYLLRKNTLKKTHKNKKPREIKQRVKKGGKVVLSQYLAYLQETHLSKFLYRKTVGATVTTDSRWDYPVPKFCREVGNSELRALIMENGTWQYEITWQRPEINWSKVLRVLRLWGRMLRERRWQGCISKWEMPHSWDIISLAEIMMAAERELGFHGKCFNYHVSFHQWEQRQERKDPRNHSRVHGLPGLGCSSDIFIVLLSDFQTNNLGKSVYRL